CRLRVPGRHGPPSDCVSMTWCVSSGFSHGALLDGLVRHLLRCQRHHSVNEYSGHVDVVRIDLTGFDELLDLGDGGACGLGGRGIEVPGRGMEHEVAVTVTDGGAHEGVVGSQRL